MRGARLEESVFGASAGSGDLLERFGPGVMFLTAEALLAGEQSCLPAPGIFAADVESEKDLAVLAHAGQKAGIKLFCGSAGLAGALAGGEYARAGEPEALLDGRAWLVLAGSQNPVTREQVARLADRGTVVETADENYDHLRVVTLLEQGDMLVIAAPALRLGAREDPSEAGRIAALALEAIRPLISADRPEPLPGLLLTGGDTALAACAALGCDRIDLTGEVEPGVAMGIMRGGILDGAPVITKAGGFGGPDTLVRILPA